MAGAGVISHQQQRLTYDCDAARYDALPALGCPVALMISMFCRNDV
jgi:hypothetical protein